MKLFLPATMGIFLLSQADAWSLGPRYYGLAPMTARSYCTPATRMLEKQQALMKKAFAHVSPRYEIVDNEQKFQVSIDVPGVKMEDIHVSLEDNAVLQIKGSRAVGDGESYSYTSQFSQSFSVDPTVDVEKFSASLNSGVLVISAPKDLKKIEENIRKIPIMEAVGHASTEEMETSGEVEVEIHAESDAGNAPHSEAANDSPQSDTPEAGTTEGTSEEPTNP
mmetsp:Transcript_7345/g.15000  ORF Transcript_7345/g.15000 Transcript_7345/m.15000 type:complete len:222 (+) Transcript_7345:47-712(+)